MRFTAVSGEVQDTAVLFYSFRWDVRKNILFCVRFRTLRISKCPANALKINYFLHWLLVVIVGGIQHERVLKEIVN